MTEDAEALREELARLKRRQSRNLRKARAEGLLSGVASLLGPGDVVCDCGANVGDVTAVLAATGARVHAFEPDPYCVERLRVRFADASNVTIHAAAVGTEDGTVLLHRAANFADNPQGASVKSTVVGGGRSIDETPDQAIPVRLIDFVAFLQGLVAEAGEVAFVKMDIEGAELGLLDAMEREGLFGSIRLTVAETHENKFKGLREEFRALRGRLARTYPRTRVDLDWI